MNKTFTIAITALSFFVSTAYAMDKDEHTSPQQLAKKYETSPETIEQKLEGLADSFADELHKKMIEDARYGRTKNGVYEAIRKADSNYNLGPLNSPKNYSRNLEILKKENVQKAIGEVTNKEVDNAADKIKAVQSSVTTTWAQDLKDKFNKSDLVYLVKAHLFAKTMSGYISSQESSLRSAERGKIHSIK